MDACNRGQAVRSRPANSMPAKRGLAFLALALLASCTDPLIDRYQERVYLVLIESGDWQAAEVGTTLAQPLVVRLYNVDGEPVEGAVVRFDGTGDPIDLESRSDGNGRASMRWRLGPIAGIQGIEASVVGPNAPEPIYF